MTAQGDTTLNVIRGKNMSGQATKEDVERLFEHIDALEAFLDEYECDDVFGTQGWRYAIGIGE